MSGIPFLYVANWKMNFSFNRAIQFTQDNKKNFEILSKQKQSQIVLCPSFEVLSEIYSIIKDIDINLGAQDCSRFSQGPHTGEVAAESLAQLGCKYCLVGHSEAKNYLRQTDEDIAEKYIELVKHNIIPILCVGETLVQLKKQETEEVIKKQLLTVFEKIKVHETFDFICIAYEPIWAIGAGRTPDNKQIEAVLTLINSLVIKHLSKKPILLYGGSVDEFNASKLKKISTLGGLLIGGASLDFQKFEKIVT